MPTYVFVSQHGPVRHLIINAMSKVAALTIMEDKLKLKNNEDYMICAPELRDGMIYAIETKVSAGECTGELVRQANHK